MSDTEKGWFLPKSALNELQIETIERFLLHARRAHEIDCKIRKDAHETWYQFDFIKHLKPT
jgi:hypothetical protein